MTDAMKVKYGNIVLHQPQDTDSGLLMLEVNGWRIPAIDEANAERLTQMFQHAFDSGRAYQRREIQSVLGMRKL